MYTTPFYFIPLILTYQLSFLQYGNYLQSFLYQNFCHFLIFFGNYILLINRKSFRRLQFSFAIFYINFFFILVWKISIISTVSWTNMLFIKHWVLNRRSFISLSFFIVYVRQWHNQTKMKNKLLKHNKL